MTFPLWYVLIPFAVIVLFAALFLFFNVFHLMRYGIGSGTYVIIVVYILGFVGILGISLFLLSAFPWGSEVNPIELLPFDLNAKGNYSL